MLHDHSKFSRILPVLAVALSVVAANMAFAEGPAIAQDDDAISLSANVSLVSDYRFRGISLSDKDIALQGGLDLGTSSGFYAGTWASSIETYAGSETELDLYGGYGGEMGELSYDVGFLAYLYPGSSPDLAGGTAYYELYASISGAVKSLEWSAGVAYAFDQDNIGGDDNLYLYMDGSLPVSDSVSLDGHFGYEDGAFGDDKLDWSLGASYSFDKFSIGLAYVDTNVDGLGAAGVMASIGASF